MHTLLRKAQFIVLVVLSATIAIHGLGQDTFKDYLILPESDLRQTVFNPVMPTYPEEAIQKKISGLIRVRIEISATGEVLRIKVKPGTNMLLAQAVADVVKDWRFRPLRGIEGIPSYGRLSFLFVLREDGSSVEFYNPPLDAPDRERLGYSNSAQDMREWQKWEEIPLRKTKE